MIRLTDSIAPTYGNPEDIAPVQVLLARAKHRLRPFWRGEIDGEMTAGLRTAIEMFQYEAGILAPPLREDPGWIHPGGPTFTALKAAVPAALTRIRVLPGTAEVFMTKRSARVLGRELDRIGDLIGVSDPAHCAEVSALIEACQARLCLQLGVIDTRAVATGREVRIGVKGLSLPLPGGVFHTVPATNPWMVPEEFWAAIQDLAPEGWRFAGATMHDRGWPVPVLRRQDAA